MSAVLAKMPDVIRLSDLEARQRGLPATEGATVIAADRPLYRVDLECPMCIHEPVCGIRRGLKSTSFEMARPEGLPPEMEFTAPPEVHCSEFVASEEIFVQAGLEPEGRPLWRSLLAYAIVGVACAIAVAMAYQAGWLYR